MVELRFFGGLNIAETAEVLKVSADTVMRDWRLAKVWLLRELSAEKPDEPECWQQIERLYHAALELNPAERAAFLREACAGEEPVRCDVKLNRC